MKLNEIANNMLKNIAIQLMCRVSSVQHPLNKDKQIERTDIYNQDFTHYNIREDSILDREYLVSSLKTKEDKYSVEVFDGDGNIVGAGASDSISEAKDVAFRTTITTQYVESVFRAMFGDHADGPMCVKCIEQMGDHGYVTKVTYEQFQTAIVQALMEASGFLDMESMIIDFHGKVNNLKELFGCE